MSFTFVNTTGTPALSKSDAKRMRSHITKTNFAIRRERLKTNSNSPKGKSNGVILKREARPGNLLLATPPKDPIRYARYLSQFWSLVMVDGPFPKTPYEEAFLQQMASEASLAEISIGLGMRHWSPDASVQRKAAIHSSNAASLIIQRIKSQEAFDGPVLGAVLSMAIGERLLNNVPIWNIHIDGLAKMITERRVQGARDLPTLVCAFMIIDATNYVFDFPLAYHRKLIDAIIPYNYQPVNDVAVLADCIIQFRTSVDIHRKLSIQSVLQAQEIHDVRNDLLCRVRALRLVRHQYSEVTQYIQVTAISMELTLYLTWNPEPDSALDLTPIASELREAIISLPVRPCMFMDLASIPLMLGAVAADEGSEVREWFVEKIRKAVVTLKSRGWHRPLEVLERAFVPDDGLVSRFRALWREVDSYED